MWKATASSCPYHGWRFGADGSATISYHDGAISSWAAGVKSWEGCRAVRSHLGLVRSREGGEPDSRSAHFGDWQDETYVTARGLPGRAEPASHGGWTILPTGGQFESLHPRLHRGALRERVQGHNVIQRQCGGTAPWWRRRQRRSAHRHLAGTMAPPPGRQGQRYVQPSAMIMHTPIEDGRSRSGTTRLVKTAHGGLPTVADEVAAKQFREAAAWPFPGLRDQFGLRRRPA